MKKYKEIRINNPVYRRKLQIFYGPGYKKFCEDFEYQYNEIANGITYNRNLSHVIYLIDLTYDTLIHEIQHIVFERADEIFTDHTPTQGYQEFFAHNINFILNEVKKNKKFWKSLKRSKE